VVNSWAFGGGARMRICTEVVPDSRLVGRIRRLDRARRERS